MIRLLLSLFLLLVGILLTIITLYLAFRLWRNIKIFTNKAKQWTAEQYQQWRQPKTDIPFLKAARLQLFRIQVLREKIQTQWHTHLDPALLATEELLSLCEIMPEQADRARRFFKVTLTSLEELCIGLHDIQEDISKKDSQEAINNILLIHNEAIRNKAKLIHKRRFDFQVMMETIKQRHK